jgi:Cys-tRNA(Pro)/Cys-tRNA(Cys) deacylase
MTPCGFLAMGTAVTTTSLPTTASLAELTPVTGYQRGGCSPVGMKKKLRTWVDEMASAFERIYVNAGTRGMQVILSPADLCRAAEAQLADLT